MSLSPLGPVAARPDFPPLTVSLPPNTDAVGVPAPSRTTCANCLAPLAAQFCGECGAPRLEDRPLTVRRFADDAWNELTSLDSATMRTARSLFARPGELTRAYLDGRTRWYLSPLRVYMLAFGAFLFGQSLLSISYDEVMRNAMKKSQAAHMAAHPAAPTPAAGAAPSGTAPSGTVASPAAPPTTATPAARAKAERNAKRSAVLATLMPRMMSAVTTALLNPWAQLLDVAPWALVLSWLYRARRRNYAEHAVMAMHLLAVNTLLQLAGNAMRVALGIPIGGLDAIAVLHAIAIGTYFFLAARRVYEEGPRVTAGKSVLFVIGAELSIFAVMLLLILATIAQTVVQMLMIR